MPEIASSGRARPASGRHPGPVPSPAQPPPSISRSRRRGCCRLVSAGLVRHTRVVSASGTARSHPERAEPRSIGTSGGRDTLAREVRLLGALLGEIILEQAGPEVFELVESTRQRAIAARRRGRDERVAFDVLPVEAGVLEGVVRSFGLYFQLVNLAEARDRVRRAGRLARATGGASEGARLRAALRR